MTSAAEVPSSKLIVAVPFPRSGLSLLFDYLFHSEEPVERALVFTFDRLPSSLLTVH